jgi:hypothetical protein
LACIDGSQLRACLYAEVHLKVLISPFFFLFAQLLQGPRKHGHELTLNGGGK